MTTLKDIGASFELRRSGEVRKDYHLNYMVTFHWKYKALKRKAESFQRIEEKIWDNYWHDISPAKVRTRV